MSETADKGQRTVSFNTTKEQCNRVCSSPKLANICQQGATCKIRSGVILTPSKSGWKFKCVCLKMEIAFDPWHILFSTFTDII